MSGSAAAPAPPPRRLWLLVTVLLLAGALRAYGVGRQALRGDEAFSVRFSTQPVGAIVAASAATEPNPPLYWFLLHGWLPLAGTSELAARWPSVLAGVVAVAAAYRLGAGLAGRGAGALAALLAAVSPFLIWYAQDARVYSLLAALVTAAAWLTWAAARGRAPWRWLAAGGLWWLALFAHYFAALSAVALALLLAAGTRRRWRPAALMFAGVAAAYLPWALHVAPLLAGHRKDWVAPLSLAAALGRSLAAAAAGTQAAGGTPALRLAGAILLGLMAVLGAGWALRRRPSAGIWLLAAGLGPSLLLWALSLARPVYTEQYAFGSVPALLALGACGVHALARAWPRGRWPAFVPLAGLALAGLLASSNAAFDPAFAKSPDWRALNHYLAGSARAGEVVVVNLPEPAFYHYYTGSMPVETSPPRPLDQDAIPETEAQLAALRDRYQHIRLLFQPTPGYDPDGFVGQWLEACCEKTADEFVSGWRVQTFDTPAGSLAARQAYAVPFANGLELTGYRLLDSAPRPGQTLHLTLYWTTRAAVAESYTVFVHLLAADGFDVGGADSLPVNGRRPTNDWAVAESIIDPHRLPLPAGLPPGEYALEVGLYQLETGERVPSRLGSAVRLPVTVRVLTP